ncbi:MAG TPA: ParB N-terminal domain-containing protein [Thermoanaerobaculia bacterium]|nr:ParB N-terminal domain-containing protein [Thermoanaerobaculia bacterium]
MPPRRKKAKEASRGLTAAEVAATSSAASVEQLRGEIESDGGSVLSAFRDPLGGHWQVLAALPVDRVAPTPFQRDLSEAHVKRLTNVIDGLGRYLDPIIAVRAKEGGYWTPNGNHRLSAMRKLGARSIVALVLPEPEIAYKILALNTEKAHNLRERSLEVIRMARDLASAAPLPEKDYVLDFEEPALLTLGVCYEKNGRFPGGAYHPVLKRVDEFFEEKLPKALEKREKRAALVMELEEAVAAAIKGLQAKGFQSPYLRAFVVARINPLRFQKGVKASFDPTMEKMLASAKKFKPESVKADQLARTGGPPEE